MRVEFAFIAEAADAVGGLFYVTRGGTDIFHIPPGTVYPVGVGPMSFVVRLSGDPLEIGVEHPVDFSIVDADGRPTGVQGEGLIHFSEHPFDRTRTGGALLHYRIMSIAIPASGAYVFQLHSNERRLCEIPFWVVETPLPGT